MQIENLQPLPRLVSAEDSPSPSTGAYRSDIGKRGCIATFSPAVRKSGLLWRYVQDACELSFVMGGASDSSSIIGLTEARMMVANLRGVDVSLVRKGDRGVRQLRGKAVSELREFFHSLELDSVRGASVLRDLALGDGTSSLDLSSSDSSSSSTSFIIGGTSDPGCSSKSKSTRLSLTAFGVDSGWMTDIESSELSTWEPSSSASSSCHSGQSRMPQRLRCTLTGFSSAQEIFDDTDFIDAPEFESEMLVHSTSLERGPNRTSMMTGTCMMRAKRHSITDDDGFHIISEAMSTPTTTDETGSEAVSDCDSTMMLIRRQMGARRSISLSSKKGTSATSAGLRTLKKLSLLDRSSGGSTLSEEESLSAGFVDPSLIAASAAVSTAVGSSAGGIGVRKAGPSMEKSPKGRPSLKRRQEQSRLTHLKLARLMHAPFDV